MELHPELSERRVEQIFTQMDLAHNGEVDYTEFLAATISSQTTGADEPSAPSIKTAFHLIDSDHDGLITRADLKRTFGGLLQETALQRILSKVDATSANGQGQINFTAFQTLMLEENRRSDDVANALKSQALAHQADMAKRFSGRTTDR